MKPSLFISTLLRHPLSLPHFSLKILIFLCAFVLFACSQKPRLTIFNWANLIDMELIKKFEKEQNVKVVVETYDTNEEMLIKFNNSTPGYYDLLAPGEYIVSQLLRENKLAKLNLENIPNRKYIDPIVFKKQKMDPEGDYFAPYLITLTAVAYNTEFIQNPPHTLQILLDPQYKNKILMIDSIRDAFTFPLGILGYSFSTTHPQEIKEAGDLLKKQAPLVLAYENTNAPFLMERKEAILAHIWIGDLMYLIAEAPYIDFFFPQEKNYSGVDSFVIPLSSKNKELAEKFINFMYEPENNLQNFRKFPYVSPHILTLQTLSRENPQFAKIMPEIAKFSDPTRYEHFEYLSPEVRALYEQQWMEVLQEKSKRTEK